MLSSPGLNCKSHHSIWACVFHPALLLGTWALSSQAQLCDGSPRQTKLADVDMQAQNVQCMCLNTLAAALASIAARPSLIVLMPSATVNAEYWKDGQEMVTVASKLKTQAQIDWQRSRSDLLLPVNAWQQCVGRGSPVDEPRNDHNIR